MFFPGLHLGPRARGPQANQQMNRGQEAGLRSACHSEEGKKEGDWGSLVAGETETIRDSVAAFWRYLAKNVN